MFRPIAQLVRLAAQYRTLVCCLLLAWAICTIFGTLYLTSWNKSVVNSAGAAADLHYPNIQHVMRMRTAFNVFNPKVARAYKYCSPLLDGGKAEEGIGISGSQLEMVVVMTRHGDRGPIQEFVNLTSIDCSVNRTNAADYDEFIAYKEAAETTRRHRRLSKDPFLHYSAIPRASNSCQPGQLTEWGALQQWRTGRLLRKAYATHSVLSSSLFNETQLKADQLTVISTLYERTYQSAIAFLYGLIPNLDLTNVAFKVGLSSTLCSSPQYCRCPLADKMRDLIDREKSDYVTSHPAVQNLLEKVNGVLQRGRHNWNKIAESQPETIMDQLLAFICHRTSLPCDYNDNTNNNGDTKSTCVTVDHLNNLVSFVEWRGKLLAKSQRMHLMSRLSIHGFLTDLLHKLGEIQINHRLPHKRFILYSAHDVTLMPLLVSLGLYDGTRPPYSSRLVWELHSCPLMSSQYWSTDSTNKRLFHLKIIYNGKDVTKRVIFCEQAQNVVSKDDEFGFRELSSSTVLSSAIQLSLCPLDNFVQFVNHDFFREFNASSFRQACAID